MPPMTLLVPPELQQTAKELLQSDFIQRAVNDTPTGNALKGAVSLDVEPCLTNADQFSGTSTKAWHLFAGPQDMPIVVAFLQGRPVPVVEFFEFDADLNVLAAAWRVYFDYGCAFGDSEPARSQTQAGQIAPYGNGISAKASSKKTVASCGNGLIRTRPADPFGKEQAA